MALLLGDALKPLEPVTFLNGVTCPARRLDADGWKLYREAEADPTSGVKALALLKWIVPDATDAEWLTLDEDGVIAGQIIAHSFGKLRTVQETLRNGAGAAKAASPPRRSSRTTTRNTR